MGYSFWEQHGFFTKNNEITVSKVIWNSNHIGNQVKLLNGQQINGFKQFLQFSN